MLIVTILIVLFSLVALMALHEWGHFIVAKKCGVRVDEFGIGYPPRIWGKKIGETVYSINLLPFGAFVKIPGEEREIKGPRTFHNQPIWQRILILLGGVVTFWIIAFIIFSVIAGVWGLPTAVSSQQAENAQVQVVKVAEESPAKEAGIEMGDVIVKMGMEKEKPTKIENIKGVQEFVHSNAGEKVSVYLKRGEIVEKKLTPRENPPEGEGAMGVALANVARVKSPWYQAPIKGAKVTAQQTYRIPVVLGDVIGRAIKGKEVKKVKVAGPVGIGEMMGGALKVGVDRYLMFIGMISVWLALFNVLPIPALDGGRILFLLIEGVRRKPIPKKIEQKTNTFFFLTLVLLMVIVTVKDIINLF